MRPCLLLLLLAVSPDLGAQSRQSEQLIVGAVDPTVIEKVIRTHERELKRCGSGLGPFAVHLTIGQAGTVTAVGISSMLGASVQKCITDRAAHWQFPALDGEVEVSWHFGSMHESPAVRRDLALAGVGPPQWEASSPATVVAPGPPECDASDECIAIRKMSSRLASWMQDCVNGTSVRIVAGEIVLSLAAKDGRLSVAALQSPAGREPNLEACMNEKLATAPVPVPPNDFRAKVSYPVAPRRAVWTLRER
jgi:hypothetical protein